MTQSSPEAHGSARLSRNVAAWQLPELQSSRFERKNSGSTPTLTAEALAYRRGWEEGQAAKSAEMEESFEATLASCHTAQRAMGEASEVLRRQLVATVHALAVGIARHLIEWEITQDPTHVRSLVARAIALAPMHGPVTVRMNPDDLTILQTMGGITESVPDSIELRWVADEAIGRGGCVLEGPASIIDGRVDRALLDIYERLGHE